MKIYTKTGDQGETGLFRGPRVAKHHNRVEAYGNVDELNAILGVALTDIQAPEVRETLSAIQHTLFEIGTDLATPVQDSEDPRLRIPAGLTEQVEAAIDRFEEKLPELTRFILPGGSKGGALLHYARTVCRRAERSISALKEQDPINPELLRYINRLSDLLFVLARAENHARKAPEALWRKPN